jgi:23S rRNA (pseudouridine1915-N3)-methyltransferase
VVSDQKPRRYYEEAAREYEKRLGRFCKVRRAGAADAIGKRDFVINISTAGRRISSEEMADRLSAIESRGDISRVIFIFAAGKNERVDETWALASIETPVDFQAVLLLEQIYRSRKIMRNEPYHK